MWGHVALVLSFYIFHSQSASAAGLGNFEGMYSAASRFGVIVMQKMLSSPPLPSPSPDKKRRISVSAAYSAGKVDGRFTQQPDQYNNVPIDVNYYGDPKGYGVGLGYTSSSAGKYSYFLYGVYLAATADVSQKMSSNTDTVFGIKNNKVGGMVAGSALNMILVGDLNAPVNVSAFAGVQVSQTKWKGGWGVVSSANPADDLSLVDPVGGEGLSYGPILGTQVKFRFGNFAIVPYGLYYVDASDRCFDLWWESTGSGSGTEKCIFKINSSYIAAGLGMSWGRLRFTAYSDVWGKVDQDDAKISTYQLGYSFEF